MSVLIVTGGGRGIGRAIAIGAARRGAAVCFSYRSKAAEAQETVATIEALGGAAYAVQADCSNEDDVARLFAEADALGPLTALVNNAGIMAPLAPVADMTAERLERIFRTNVIGTFLTIREAIPGLSTKGRGGGGAIVNISSAAARIGGAGGAIDYAATKGAIDTLTRGLAVELAPDGIRVNAVAPGVIATEMHADTGDADRARKIAETVPMKRVGEADEVAAAVLWLLSTEASYVTGSILSVSGGR